MAGVAPRSARSFLGSGMIGQALAHAGGLVPTVERLGTVAPAKSIGPPSVSTSGGTTTYEVTGTGTVDVEVPSGVYLCTGTYSVTLVDDVTGLFIDVEIAESYQPPVNTSTTVSATAGTALSCTTSGAFVVPTASTFTMTPSVIGGGPATAESSTLRATRIADA